MPRFAQTERQSLANLFLALGPDAPTLCEGWTTRDLAAHVVVRERRPDSAVGLVLPALRGHSERVRLDVAALPYPDLVDLVRSAPWWSPLSNPLVDGLTNTVEMFIHHEDVRRAQPHWSIRALPMDAERALWSALRGPAKLSLRQFPAAVTIQAPGFGETTAGRGGDRVRLVGAPGELLLFLSGRQRAARAQVDAAPGLADRIRRAHLGI